MAATREIWTIGHSNRSSETFVDMLRSFDIGVVADVRRFPGSRKYPHFNKEQLEATLAQHGIDYVHMIGLGGRRKAAKDSPNSVWKNDAFRAYADYMETTEFKNEMAALEQLASTSRLAYMCSEAVWWSCHRSMISDWLKAKDWTVMHIMDVDKAKEHPFTAPARVENGNLSYRES